MARALLWSIILGFIFVLVFNYLYHGVFLIDYYEATKHLWRDQAGMAANAHYNLIGQIIFVTVLAIIYTYGHKKKDANEGVRFGLLIGWLLSAEIIAMYTYQPIPFILMVAWVVGTILKTIGLGVIFNLCFSCPHVMEEMKRQEAIDATARPPAKKAGTSAAAKKPAAKKKATPKKTTKKKSSTKSKK